MTVLARTILFVSSYAPLLFLFALLDSFGDGWPSRLCVIAGAVSIAGLGILLAVWRFGFRPESPQPTFLGARTRDSDVMAYVVSYVVPFASATDRADDATRYAMALFAALIAVLYIRSAVYYVHPLLLLFGIHVYEASLNDVPVVILSRQRHLRQQSSVSVVSIDTNVYLERKA